jgi:hypothetical protein
MAQWYSACPASTNPSIQPQYHTPPLLPPYSLKVTSGKERRKCKLVAFSITRLFKKL